MIAHDYQEMALQRCSFTLSRHETCLWCGCGPTIGAHWHRQMLPVRHATVLGEGRSLRRRDEVVAILEVSHLTSHSPTWLICRPSLGFLALVMYYLSSCLCTLRFPFPLYAVKLRLTHMPMLEFDGSSVYHSQSLSFVDERFIVLCQWLPCRVAGFKSVRISDSAAPFSNLLRQ